MDYQKELRTTWWQAWLILARTALLILAAGVHWMLNRGIELVIPLEHFASLRQYMESVTAIAFSIAYVRLVWDILSVFVPLWRRRPADRTGQKKGKGK